MADTQQMLTWTGRKMRGTDGAKLGTIEEIYVDDATGAPEWALVNTGLFGSSSTFVPLAEASDQDDEVAVPYSKAQVKDAPRLDRDQHLEQGDEERLYQHYGLSYGESRSDSGLPQGGDDRQGGQRPERTGDAPQVGHDTSGPTTDDAMTRSEEQVRVGTQSRETGTARLRKHVVTEQVEVPVTTSHEEVRVSREPITDANRGQAEAGPAFSSEEHEVTLHEEVPVVEKEVVAKERIRLDTDTVRDEQQVTEEVRKERIDVDDDADPSSRR